MPFSMVPQNWGNFFSALLLSPDLFSLASELLKSDSLLSCISDEPRFKLGVPTKCPLKKFPSCQVTEILEDENATESDKVANPFSGQLPDGSHGSLKKKGKNKTAIVETEVRRSPRLKECRKGFLSPTCVKKNCVGCVAEPPTLSSKAIRKLGTTLCGLNEFQLTDDSLNKKVISAKAVVGDGKSKKKGKQGAGTDKTKDNKAASKKSKPSEDDGKENANE